MINRPILLFLTLSVAVNSYAAKDTFNTEITTHITFGDYEKDYLQADLDTFSVGGKLYINDVDIIQGQPLKEMAFLNKSSSVALISYGRPSLLGLDADIKGYSASVDYVTQSDYIFSSQLKNVDIRTHNQLERFGLFQRYDTLETLTLSIGKYINDSTTLRLSYHTRDVDTRRYYITAATATATDSQSLSIIAKQLKAISEYGHISLEGKLTAIDVDTTYEPTRKNEALLLGVGATYYPNSDIGIGVSAQLDTANNWQIDNYELHGSWFVTKTTAIELSYKLDDNIRAHTKTSTFSVGASFRF